MFVSEKLDLTAKTLPQNLGRELLWKGLWLVKATGLPMLVKYVHYTKYRLV